MASDYRSISAGLTVGNVGPLHVVRGLKGFRVFPSTSRWALFCAYVFWLAAVTLLVLGTNRASAQPAVGLPRAPSPPTQIVPIAVFGHDDRQVLPQTRQYLAESIGMLSLGEQAFCTAFCVGPDAIATASHCLLGTERSTGPDLTRVAFTLGHGARRYSLLAGKDRASMRARLLAGTAQLRITPPITAVQDWAIARLAQPICQAAPLPLAALSRSQIEAIAATGGVYQVATHRDFEPQTLVMAQPCDIPNAFPGAAPDTIKQDFMDAEDILMHTCDTGPASSGSPLLIDGVDGPLVIGINVGTYVLSEPASQTTSATTFPAKANSAIANTAIMSRDLREAVRRLGPNAPSPQSR